MTEDRTTERLLAAARRECERRLEGGEALEDVQRSIDDLPIAPDARAALWLWASAWSDRSAEHHGPRPPAVVTQAG